MDSKKSIKSKIIAHLDGELAQQDLEALANWITMSKDNARYYSQIKDLWEASLTDASEIAGTKKEWQKFERSINSKSKNTKPVVRRLNWEVIWRSAAILVMGILIGNLILQMPFKKDPVFCTAISPMGSVSKMVLPDSTLIYLNAGSEVKYSVDTESENREVYLTGEAWFKVAKDKGRKFIVHTPFYDVNVLGTEFNVKAYENENRVVTTLEEGSIQISGSEKFKVTEDIFLKPGEQLQFDKTGMTYQVQAVKTNLYTSWKDNKLEFIRMSLTDLIVLLERRYGVEIDVEDNEILAYHYSGTIKNESILDILNIIQHTLPIRYEIKEQIIKIYRK